MITRVIWKFAVCLLVMVTAACSRDELESGTGEQQVPGRIFGDSVLNKRS